MRIKGRVQLSTYRLRSYQLQVADEFIQHIKSLPLEYEKGIYFAFLEDYGTHYTRNGKTGGEYQLIYVLNEDTVKQRSTWTLTVSPLILSLRGFVLLLNSQTSPFRSDRETTSKLCQSRPQSRHRWSCRWTYQPWRLWWRHNKKWRLVGYVVSWTLAFVLFFHSHYKMGLLLTHR